MRNVLDGSYLTVMVYDNGKYFGFTRLESDSVTDKRFNSFFDILKKKTFSSFPPVSTSESSTLPHK